MSDFRAKIIADLDTSKAEQKLRELQNRENKIKIDVDAGQSGQVSDNLNKIDRSAQQVTKSANQMGRSMKSAFAAGSGAALTAKLYGEIQNAARNAVKSVKELDDACVSLRMATGESYQYVRDLLTSYNQMGQTLGATTIEVANSADAWLRQGHDIQTTNKLIRDSMILSKVANLDSAASTEYLTSAMKGYKVAADDVISIVDRLTAVDLVSATDAGGLAEGMSKVAVTADMAGVSMDRLLGYLASVGEITQDSMSSIGTAFRSIFTRMSDIKSGKLKLIDDDGTEELLSDVELTLKNVGIDLRATVNEYNSYGDVLDALAAKWDTLSQVQQNALTKAFAGTRQGNYFRVLMENYDAAKKYMDVAADSAGTAEAKFAAYEESLEAKTKSLQASFEALATNPVSTNIYAGILDASKAMLDFLNNTNLLNGALAGLATGGAIKGFITLTAGITQAAMQMQKFGDATAILKAGNLGEQSFERLLSLTDNLSKSQLNAVISSKALTAEQRIAILTNAGMSQAEAQAAISTMGLASAEGAATGTTLTLSGAMKGLWATLLANPLVLVVAGIAAAVSIAGPAIDDYIHRVDKATEKAKTSKQDFESLTSEIGNLKSKLDTLNGQKASITDASELAALESQTQELERQIQLKEALANLAQTNAANDAENVLTMQAYQVQDGTTTMYDHTTGRAYEVNNYRSANIVEYTQQQQEQLEATNAKLEKAKSELETLLSQDDLDISEGGIFGIGKGKDRDEFDRLQNNIELYENQIKALSTTVHDNVAIIEDNYESLLDENGNVVTGNQDLADSCRNFLDSFANGTSDIVSGVEDSAEQIEAVIDNLTSDIERTQSIVDSINKVQKALQAQNAGESLSLDDYNGDLRGYADALEYVNGAYQLNAEKVRELVKAQSDAQIEINNSNRAMEQSKYLENAAQIEQLRQKILDKNFAEGESAETIQSTIDALLSENGAIRNTIQQYDLINASLKEATDAYHHWLNAQKASQSGDIFDSSLSALKKINDTLNNTKSDDYGRIGNADYQAALDFVIPETVDRSDESAVNSYLRSLSSILTLDSNGNFDGLDIEAFCKQAVEKGLMVLDGDEFEIAGGKTMQDFADGMNMSLPLVQAIFGEMQEFGGQFSWADEAVQTLGDLGVAAYESAEALRSIEGNENLKIILDVSTFDDAQNAIDTLDSTIQEMNDLKASVDVDSSQVEYANSVIQYAIAQKQILQSPAVMSVDTSQITGELGDALSLLQQFHETQNTIEMQASVGADTSEAESKLNSLTTEIQGLSTDIKAKLNIDTTSIDTIQGYISGLNAEAIVKFGVDSSLVSAYQDADHHSSGEVEWRNDTSAIDRYAGSVKNASGIVRWTNNTDSVRTEFTATGRVKWINSTNPSSVNGTAHATGTAKASGDWRVKQGGKTLLGELGAEIIVNPATGKWYTVGDNGPEFDYVPQGAIVFNHLQTESLLRYGYADGRGSSLATGTALVTGKIKIPNKTTTTTTTTSNNRNNSNSNSNSNSNNTHRNSNDRQSGAVKKGLDAFKEWFEKLFDWIEVLVNRRTAKIEAYVAAAEVKIGNKNFDGAAGSYISALNDTYALSAKEIQAQEKYTEQADKVLKSAVARDVISMKVAKSIKTRVTNGTIAISEYSEKVQEVIKSYQTWADKARDAKSAIADLHANVQKYVGELKNVRDAQRDAKLDSIKTYTDIGNSTFGFSVGKQNNQLSYTNAQLANQNNAYYNAVVSRKVVGGKTKVVSGTEYDAEILMKSANAGINSALKAAKKSKEKSRDKKYQAALKNAKSAIESNKSVAAKDMDVIAKNDRAVYERIYAYNLGLKNVEVSKLELATVYAANSAEAYKNTSSAFENKNSKYESNISLYRQIASNQTSASSKNSTLDRIAFQYNSIVSNRQAEVNKFAAKIKSTRKTISGKAIGDKYKTLSKTDKAAVNKVVSTAKNCANENKPIPSGTLSNLAKYYSKGYVSLAFYKACIDYNNAIEYKAQADAQLAIDKRTAIAEKAAIGTERFSNVQKEYENSQRSNVQIGLNKATSAQALKKAKSQDLSEQDYRDLIAYNTKEATIWTNAQKATQKIIDENLKKGYWTTSSQEYLDAIAALSEYDVKIDEANSSIEGLRDALRDDVYWRTFERAHDAAQRIANVLSGINDLIDDDSLFDSDGNITDFGVARIAMLTKELASARTEVQNYANDIQNLNDLYAQGQYTELEYNEKLGELQTNLLKSASSAKSFTDSIVKMYKEMAKSELDAIFKLIEARKSALKAKKDYYDYDKKLKTKSNDIQALEAQLAALQDIDTAEARARTAKLAAELQEKQDDLTELVQDHEFDLSSNALSGLRDTLQETFDDKWDNISGDLNAITELLSASNSLATQSAAGVQSTLNQLLTFYGVNSVKTGISRNYASGTKKVPFNMTALTNENGPEIIVTPNGIITTLPAGSDVVPADLTERLYEMAANYQPDVKMPKAEFTKPETTNNFNTTVNNDNSITIEGSADAATVEDLKKMQSDILEKSYRYTSQKIHQGYVRSGGNRRV